MTPRTRYNLVSNPPVNLGGSKLLNRLIDISLPHGGYLVALYEVYLDESYTGDDEHPPLFVVGGYVMHSDNARLMEKEWREVLESFGIDHFHMVDVAPCQNDFKHLGMDRCDQLNRQMIALIKKYVIEGFATIINPKKLWLNATDPGSVYAAAVEDCITMLCGVAKQHDPEAKILFFLEAGHIHQTIANQVINSRIASMPVYSMHSFGKKKEVCLLQAADLFVWQLAKFVKDKVNRRRKPRLDFRSLVQTSHIWTCIYVHHGIPSKCPITSAMIDDPFVDRIFGEAFTAETPAETFTYSFSVGGKTYKCPTLAKWPTRTYISADKLLEQLGYKIPK
jgi:hypothetical protein